MSNPVSKNPSAQMPQIDEQVVDQNGTCTNGFHQFLQRLWQRTGSAAGINLSNTDQNTTIALQTAQQSATLAAAAHNDAIAAQAEAAIALQTAQAAQTTLTAAFALININKSGALQSANNFSDLSSKHTARLNLGVAILPLIYNFDVCPSGLKRGIALATSGTLSANFAGSHAYAGINATSDAVFLISVSRNNVLIQIGTFTVINHGAGFLASAQPLFSLSIGDVLVVTCPNPADPTLAQVGITLALNIT